METMLKASYRSCIERGGMKGRHGVQGWRCSKLIVLNVSICSTLVLDSIAVIFVQVLASTCIGPKVLGLRPMLVSTFWLRYLLHFALRP